MFASLERIDTEVVDQETGRRRCFQRDDRTAQQIRQQEEISILFALARVLAARRLGGPQEVEVVYVCAEPPPNFLRHAVASAGGTIRIQEGPTLPYDGLLSPPEKLADGAFRRLALRVLRERGAALDQQALIELQRSHALAPGREEDEPGYWTRVAELAAVAGEVLRAGWGGRWVYIPGLAALPFIFNVPLQGDSRGFGFNAVGKAQRFLARDEHESPVSPMEGAKDRGGPSYTPGTVFVTLRPMDWPGSAEVCCQPLLAQRDPKALVPWLVYGEKHHDAFRYFSKEEVRAQDLGALHAEAVKGLKALKVDVGEFKLLGFRMLAVLGNDYAAEKIVDVSFMQRLHERLGAPWLIVGMPRRGLLIVVDARMKELLVKDFLKLCDAEFRKGEHKPLTMAPLLVHEGKISGLAWEQDTQAVAEPPRGFISKLLGRKRG